MLRSPTKWPSRTLTLRKLILVAFRPCRWRSLVIALSTVTVFGCNRGPQYAEVTGIVKLNNGKPLDNVLVEFMPEPDHEPTGPRSSGVTDKTGRYVLKCENSTPGAVLGKHRILLRDLSVYGTENVDPRVRENQLVKLGLNSMSKSRISARYADVLKTPLRKEVMTSPQTIDLEVTP